MSGYKRVNYYELCRLCTSSEGVKVHIFCEDGKRRQLQNKIQICLPLQVCEDDSLPKIVCAGCLEKLEYFYDFRESCVTSEGMLESYFTSMRYSDDLLREGKVYIKESDKSRNKTKSLPQSLLNQHTNTTNEDLNIQTSNTSQTQTQTVINQNITPQQQTPIQQNIPNVVTTSTKQQQNSNITQLANLEIISQQHVQQQSQHDNTTVTQQQQQQQQQQLTQDQVQQQTQQIMPQFMISLTRPGNEVLQWQIKDNGISDRFKIFDQLPTILTQNICFKCRQLFLNTDDLSNHICTSVETYILPDSEVPDPTINSKQQQQQQQQPNNGNASTNPTTLDIQKAILSSLDLDSNNKEKTTNKECRIMSLSNNNSNSQYLTNQIALSHNALNSLLTQQSTSQQQTQFSNISFNTLTDSNNQFSNHNTNNSVFNIPNTTTSTPAPVPQTSTPQNLMHITNNTSYVNSFLNVTQSNAAAASSSNHQNNNNNNNNTYRNNVIDSNSKTNFVLTETPSSQNNVSSDSATISDENIYGNGDNKSQQSTTITNTTVAPPTTSIATTPPKLQSQVVFNVQNGLYMCDTCDKTFKRKEHLMQHRKLHSGERPFVCDKCQKSFSRKEHLIRHSVSHTGEKCFECDQCHKSFSRKDNLHKHRRTHLVSGPYVCDVCNKSFMLKHYYTIHKLTHQDDDKNNTGGTMIGGGGTTTATPSKTINANVKKTRRTTTTNKNEPQNLSPSKLKSDDDILRNSNILIQNGTSSSSTGDSIINLGQIALNNNQNIDCKNNYRSTIKFTSTNNNNSTDQIQTLMQNLAAQQNVITNLTGSNMNHLTVVQNLVPCTNLTDLTQLVNNNNVVTSSRGGGNGGVTTTVSTTPTAVATTLTTPQNAQQQNQSLTLIEQSKHLAQILTSQKYRDKYMNTNLKLDSNGSIIQTKDTTIDKNLITPAILNQGGIILFPTKNQNFISLNPQDIINAAATQQTTQQTGSPPKVSKQQPQIDIKSSKKVKYSQANINFTNNTIVTNLNQICGGKSNVLFSSSSNSNKNGIPTNVINNTIVNSSSLHHPHQQHTTNHVFQHHHTNGQQNLQTTTTSNAQFI